MATLTDKISILGSNSAPYDPAIDAKDQVLYLDRWVQRKAFRAFVYNSTGQRLAKSWDDYQQLITSGIWFSTRAAVTAAITEPTPQELPQELHPTSSNVTAIDSKRRGRKCQNQARQ